MPITLNGTTGIVGPDGSAASPAIQGSDANTGMFFPAADTIAFAEGGVEVGRFDSSSNFQFNSGYGSVATAYGCRAWVNFNGTGTVAIRASANVSSITDNSVGNYTVNFSSALVDANYAASAAAGSPGTRDGGAFVPATAVPTTTALIVRCFGSNAPDTSIDHTYVYVAVFR